MFIFALLLPLSATFAYTLPLTNFAKADESSTNYYNGYIKEMSLSNNNFDSSSSTYSISTNLSGWTGQVSNSETTGGIINVGNTFQTYMSGTYNLSNNPLSKATDKKILMINSKTSSLSGTKRQGYKSNSISLDANSYYSFQVSFKTDTNYDSYTAYVDAGTVESDTTISKDTFAKKVDSKVVEFGNYISFSYNSTTRYLLKELTPTTALTEKKEDVSFFYEDDSYYGFLLDDNTPVYVKRADVTVVDDDKYNIDAGAELFTCNLKYNPTSKNYTVNAGTKIFKTQKKYTSLNDYVYGSIYLKGLKDSNGDVKAEYVQVTSKEWVTFHFFVATGDESQTTNLQLWLGGEDEGQTSTGVVFFDDCHVYKYSENQFWDTYASYIGKSYTQEVTTTSGITTQTFKCSKFLDLRTNQTLQMPDEYNFGFEGGQYNENGAPVKNWEKSGSGNAKVFNVMSPEDFKTTTGYSFGGSPLSATATIEGETINITPNNYVLGLWANNQYVEVKSKNISIAANEILKVTAKYKTCELTDGNVYMFIEENDSIASGKYGLSSTQYTLKEKTASTGVSDNGSSEYDNKYATIEFYVKGGALYDSSFNIILALGKSDELATGAVTIDDITIEKASTSQYSEASNKVAFSEFSGSPTITNGNFNNITFDKDGTAPFAPTDWTIDGGDGIRFAGVIQTEASAYQSYIDKYNELKNQGIEDHENPYLWANLYANPRNSSNSTSDPNNILMIANSTDSWQKITSPKISLTASTAQKIAFNLKTATTVKISVYGDDGFKLYESKELTTNGNWKTFEIYLQSIAGTNEVYLTVELGNENSTKSGCAYFDNFEISTVSSEIYASKSETANDDEYGVIDMTDFYFNLPTNNITEEVKDINDVSPAYKGTLSSGQADLNYGTIVKSEKFNNSDIFKIDEEDKNVFFLNNQIAGGYALQSNFSLDLSSDTQYYVLTFKIKTNFTTKAEDLDKNKTYSYGAVVGLTGYEYMSEIKTTGDEYQTYTIYFNISSDSTAQLYIALVSDTNETTGSVVIYDIDFATSDEDAYNLAVETTEKDAYDMNSDKVFVSKADDSTDDDDSSDNDTSDDNTTTNDDNDFSWLLLISSLITSVALVIAIIGFALRKIKIRKIEKKRKESYDRKSSLNIDHIKQKAKKLRDDEVKELQTTINKFQKELDSLEAEHKQKVLALRDKDKNEMSKETDKEFKLFAKKRTVIAEKLDNLNKQLDDVKSPEHLLSLERKVYLEDEYKRKELEKASKKAHKEQLSKEKDEKKKK